MRQRTQALGYETNRKGCSIVARLISGGSYDGVSGWVCSAGLQQFRTEHLPYTEDQMAGIDYRERIGAEGNNVIVMEVFEARDR